MSLQFKTKVDLFLKEGRAGGKRDILYLNMGNPQARSTTGTGKGGGQMPITFHRQVLALCELPRDIGIDNIKCTKLFPTDVISRAKHILKGFDDYGDIGAYVEPKGVKLFREHVASFIEKRDGYPSNVDDIFLTNGASSAIQLCLKCLIHIDSDAIMVPSFHYQVYSDEVNRLGGHVVEYELDEKNDWTITSEAFEDTYRLATQTGKIVKCMCLINPGNPTGNVFSEDVLRKAIQFCAKYDIVLLADEVYQENLYNDAKFVSAKKIASSCDDNVKLISFHSTSKGYLGECGRRGGYMELYKMPQIFHNEIERLISSSLPCANTLGQILTSLMVRPPLPKDESHLSFTTEKERILSMYEERANMITTALNCIEGIDCPPVNGALYAFPSIVLHKGAVQSAIAKEMKPDELYCLELLQNTGIFVTPSSSFTTEKARNRFGFRMTLLFNEDDVDNIVRKISIHHNNFQKKYEGFSSPQPLSVRCNINKINLKRLDHYTMICDDAKKIADYHIQKLGFKLLRTIDLNTGTVPEGDVDMMNFVLQPPANKGVTLVVTEGKNEDTIFRKYMNIWNEGIHHVAFEVDDIESSFAFLKMNKIKTTSNHITKDMLSGLKQLFIDPSYAGFFIELIERPKTCFVDKHKENDNFESSPIEQKSFFARKNMVDLANSMHSLLSEDRNSIVTSERSSLNASSHPALMEHDDLEKKLPSVGPLRLIGFKVENIEESMKFLVKTFTFQFQRYDQKLDRLTFGLGSGEKDISLFIERTTEKAELRQATVVFSSSDTSLQAYNKSQELSLSSEKTTVYELRLGTDQFLNSKMRQVNIVKEGVLVQVNQVQASILKFLLDPRNLSKWTGHKSIHYSYSENSWVEIRMDPNMQLSMSPIALSQIENSVYISWPQRNLTIEISTKKLSPYITEVLIHLPKKLPTKLFCKLRRMISIEISILKAILEDSLCYIPDAYFEQVQCFHLDIFAVDTPSRNVKIPPEFKGYAISATSDEYLFRKMSTDFALTVYSIPSVILVPSSLQDIKIAINAAFSLGVSLVVRGSKISHSAGGQAQTDGGVLLDISDFKGLQFDDEHKTLKIGSGCYWNDVVQFTLDLGYMPPVVNDYQYLSVGGTISMGGVGFMSHTYGIQTGHVNELEVVTGMGDIVHASPSCNRDLYDLARCGLGQFGVVTSVTIPLVPAPKNIVTLKFFYTQHMGEKHFVNDTKEFVDLEIDMIHAFLKPCKVDTVSNIIDEKMGADFKAAIKEGESRGEIVYYVELGIYDTAEADPRNSLCHIKNIIGNMNVIAKAEGIFESRHDFMTYLHRDPPVIATNKSQGKSIPHPSFATVLPHHTTSSLLMKHIQSPNRGDDSTNEILIMPLKSNTSVAKGSSTPLFPIPQNSADDEESELSFFILFLGSAIVQPDSSDSMEQSVQKRIDSIRNHHRDLYMESETLGGKHYCYDTITSELTEADWKKHFGEHVWEKIVKGKNDYDPFYLFRSKGVKLFD